MQNTSEKECTYKKCQEYKITATNQVAVFASWQDF